MKGVYERVFSWTEENPPLPGCSASQELGGRALGVTAFALGADVGVSAERYAGDQLYLIFSGSLDASVDGVGALTLRKGEVLRVPSGTLHSLRAPENCVFAQVYLKGEGTMENIVKEQVFNLAGLIPAQPNKVISRDLIDTEEVTASLMSMGEGCLLPPHSAPGDALIIALEGEVELTCSNVVHTLRKGDSFIMPSGAIHSLKATKPYKMAIFIERSK